MKVALISDTHSMLPPAELFAGADAIIHAGDIGPDRGALPWFQGEFSAWAAKVGLPIYATWGNHDFIGGRHGWDFLPSNVCVFVDQQVSIFGVKVWFSPWSNLFGSWAWMRDEHGLAKRYAEIPADTQVIVSHGPPKNYGDKILWDGRVQNVGSVSLAERAAALPELGLIVCGHIHEAHGVYQMGAVRVLNVSYVDEFYRPRFNPTIIDLSQACRDGAMEPAAATAASEAP
jgi:Icc-related predicted phosphoesterase